MARAARSLLPAFALVGGLCCLVGYWGYQAWEPHGSFEFAYAPFTPGPLPYSPMRGFTYEQLWGHVRRVLLLGPGLLLFFWGAKHYVSLRAPRDWERCARWAIAASVLVTAVLMLGVLRGRAITDDELAYSMQAGFFRRGHVGGPDLGAFPADLFTIRTLVGYSIKYLPGEPLLQVPGILLGIPALSHLLVLLVTLLAWQRAVTLSSGPRLAALSTIALACSPMVHFTSATGLSHASCLMWVVLMGLGFELGAGTRPWRGALLAGLAFGAGVLTRPQSMVPIGAVIGCALLVRLARRRAYASVVLLGVTAILGGASLLGYNQLLTGSPLKLPWFLQCGAEHYGFGRVWASSSYEHGVATAFENLGVVALRCNSWLLGLPWSLGVVIAWALLGRDSRGGGIWLGVGVAVVSFEFFYYSPGASDTGAIYHYELVLPFALMTGIVVERALSRFADAAPLALACSLLLGTGSWIVEQGARLSRLTTVVHQDTDRLLAKVRAPALVIYEGRRSEVVVRGWVFDAFPKRFRDPRAPVVTVPRVAADMVARASRTYPGRECWYFHYRPGTAQPELLRCSEAKPWLERSLLDDGSNDPAPFVERSTAYLKTDYAPTPYVVRQLVRDPSGAPIQLCCQVRNLERASGVPQPLASRTCFETGEP
jgi:Dolichyl-phosphate-mannose-protein mannosyltransferase